MKKLVNVKFNKALNCALFFTIDGHEVIVNRTGKEVAGVYPCNFIVDGVRYAGIYYDYADSEVFKSAWGLISLNYPELHCLR